MGTENIKAKKFLEPEIAVKDFHEVTQSHKAFIEADVIVRPFIEGIITIEEN